MTKTKFLKVLIMLFAVSLLSIPLFSSAVFALNSQSSTYWYWTSDTNVTATAVGDVNGDGVSEIVTVGYYNNGTNWIGQLIVWNPFTLAAEAVTNWLWGKNTYVSSVAIGNCTGGTTLDIVTGGSYDDGTNWIGQLLVWNGVTLAAERVTTWNWGTRTAVNSVAVGNVTGGATMDIVTGGSYDSGAAVTALLLVWNGNTLAVERGSSWNWGTHTLVNSVVVANVTGGATMDIVTGGSYDSGAGSIAQMLVWNGNPLTAVKGSIWNSGTSTLVNSVTVANVTGASTLDIITAGTYNSGTAWNAQVLVWNGNPLSAIRGTFWLWGANTTATSVAVANVTGGSSLDVVTVGAYNDGLRSVAQLIEWNGATFGVNGLTTWFKNADTAANSVAIVNAGFGNRIVEAGQYYDGVRSVAQLTVWG
jgi:hypothetical protein